MLERPRVRWILEQHFLLGRLQKEIGAELGVSESRVNQMLKGGLREIRRRLRIGGQMNTMQMESRRCACGCGQDFRVMSTSQQKYASQACEALITPGGMNMIRKNTFRKPRVRAIAQTAEGQIGSTELAKLLGVSYQTIYNWMKTGKITPVEGEGRNKVFDVAQVREQVAAMKHVKLAAPAEESEKAAVIEATDPDLSARIEALPEREGPADDQVEELEAEKPASPARPKRKYTRRAKPRISRWQSARSRAVDRFMTYGPFISGAAMGATATALIMRFAR